MHWVLAVKAYAVYMGVPGFGTQPCSQSQLPALARPWEAESDGLRNT